MAQPAGLQQPIDERHGAGLRGHRKWATLVHEALRRSLPGDESPVRYTQSGVF